MIGSIPAATRASRREVDEILTAFLASCGLALQKTPALPAPERWAALLPEAARYGYLWLTIPSRDRVHFLRQFLSASRNAAGVGICQGASHQAP